jgi:rubrerythrin
VNRKPLGGTNVTTIETAPTATFGDQQLGLIIQYTVEAYKTFEKLAENLPNPMAATTFKQFAVDERENRDLLEMKAAASGKSRVKVTLGGDLQFQDVLEGDLSYRELTEFLIARERTMERRMADLARTASATDRNLLVYLVSTKRAHVVELERELEMIKGDADWFKREDAQWRIVHGSAS